MIRRISITLLTATAVLAQNGSRLEGVVQPLAANKMFMGSVLVARGNQVLLNKSYGFANLEWNIPNSPTTKFALASVTKQFTAASILMLEERGRLKTSDLIKSLMPDAPPAWDHITIFHLLTHTSGIPNFTAFPDYAVHEALPATPEKTVAYFRINHFTSGRAKGLFTATRGTSFWDIYWRRSQARVMRNLCKPISSSHWE